jgi:hypothetical protein
VVPPVWQQLLCPLPEQVASRFVQQMPLAVQLWPLRHGTQVPPLMPQWSTVLV